MDTKDQSQLYQTALSVIDGYNKWDIDAILAPRASDCTQEVLPYRLGRPAMGNTDYREYFSKLMPCFSAFHVEVLDVVEDSQNHKVAISARSQGQTVIGPYANEYMLIIQTTTDHLKVIKVKEFIDSGSTVEFFGKLREHMSKAAPKS